MPSFDGMNGESMFAGSARMQLTESSGAIPGLRQVSLNVAVRAAQLRRPERVSEWHSLQRCVEPSTLAPSNCKLCSASDCCVESHLPPPQLAFGSEPSDDALQPATAASAMKNRA